MKGSAGFWTAAALVLLLGACGDADEGSSAAGSNPLPAEPGPDPGPVPPGPVPPPPAPPPADQTHLLFQDDELNDVRLTMSPADWDSIIQDTLGDTYRKTSFQWKGIVLHEVGVRPSGSASRFPGNPKMSLRLDFNQFIPGQKFLGLKDLKLDGMREGTMIKERLSYDVFRTRLAAVPRTVHCRLFVNEEYRGVYLVEERVTGTMMRHRYGGEDAANLYRIRVDSPEAFAWRGTDPALYVPDAWEPKTNELTGDFSDVPQFCDLLNNRPAEFATICNLDNLADHLACEAVTLSRDGILRDAGPPHNAYLYHRPDTGLFELVPWDVDATWSSSEAARSIWHNFGNTALTRFVRDTPALNALYRQKLLETSNGAGLPATVAARIDYIYQQIRDAAHADPYKRYTNEQFDDFPARLKETARTRYEVLQAQLASP